MGKKTKKVKSEGRKPVLAEYVKEGFNIFASYKKREFKARVRADGVIVFRDKEYATLNAAGMVAIGTDHGIDGWKFWRFKKDGDEVPLDVLRGKDSPRKAVIAKPNREKKSNAAKPNGSPAKKSSPHKRRADRKEAPATAPEAQAAVA